MFPLPVLMENYAQCLEKTRAHILENKVIRYSGFHDLPPGVIVSSSAGLFARLRKSCDNRPARDPCYKSLKKNTQTFSIPGAFFLKINGCCGSGVLRAGHDKKP